jgi:hypothetical protein
MPSMKERFVARFQHNLESWRAGEIDYVTFNECNRETWEAIAEAGKDVEADVVAGLHGEALHADVGLLADDEQRTTRVRAASRSGLRLEAPRYRGDLLRTTKGPTLRISPTTPVGQDAEHRQVAAVIYELAAHMERLSHQLEAHWTIAPDADSCQVAVELAGDHEVELADELLTNVMIQHQLI